MNERKTEIKKEQKRERKEEKKKNNQENKISVHKIITTTRGHKYHFLKPRK